MHFLHSNPSFTSSPESTYGSSASAAELSQTQLAMTNAYEKERKMTWSELFFEAHPQWSIIVWTMDELRGMRMQNRKTFELYDIPAAAKRDIIDGSVLIARNGADVQ